MYLALLDGSILCNLAILRCNLVAYAVRVHRTILLVNLVVPKIRPEMISSRWLSGSAELGLGSPCIFLFLLFCLNDSLKCSDLLSYVEGSHFSEHKGLSFLGRGKSIDVNITLGNRTMTSVFVASVLIFGLPPPHSVYNLHGFLRSFNTLFSKLFAPSDFRLYFIFFLKIKLHEG